MENFTKKSCWFLSGKPKGILKTGILLILMLTVFLFNGNAFAQITITGTVTDKENSLPIPGANVFVEGTSQGTITDLNGKYTLTVTNPEGTISFSFIGYTTLRVPIENRTIIDISLSEDTQNLDEVVVIGYGTVKKSDLTGSVAVVSTKDLTKNPSFSAAQALQGRAPGVLVSQSGKPGSGPTIRVRGVGSINASSNPIYIVDGVQVGNIDNIQAQDIETMQVLKDASASAIYGANGSNGVIIVTTKRGKSGAPVVNLNAYVGVNLAPKRYDVMNADEYAAFYSKLYGAKPEYEQAFREKYYGEGWREGTDWQKEMFHNGLTQNYNLSVSGGGDKSNYSVSFGNVKDNGNVIKSNAERYTLRANSDFKLNDFIKVGESFSMNYGITEDPITVQTSVWELNTSPLMKIYNPYYKGGFENYQAVYWEDAEGNLKQGAYPVGYTGPFYTNTVGNDKPNLLAAPSLGENKNYSLGTFASVYMQVDFTKSLTFKVTPAAEVFTGRRKNWLPNFEGNRSPGAATLSENYNQGVALNLENQLSFNKKFNDVHNVQATAVYSVRSVNTHSIEGAVNGFDFEQLNTLTNGGTASSSIKGYEGDSRILSYLGRIIYDYKGTYFLTASLRSDGTSNFAPGHNRDNFAAASVAWKINELLFKNIEQIDAVKLRLGWGQTGNSNVNGDFNYLDIISDATNFSPVFGDDQHIARAQYVFYYMGNKVLHWETAEMLNAGIDVSLFNNRLQSSLEYYVKNNNDLLVHLGISPIFGRQDGDPWVNLADIQNKGLEFSLQWRDKIGDFSYGINTSLTTIFNEVISIPEANTDRNNRTTSAHTIADLYGYVSEGIIQLNEDNYETDSEGNFTQVNGVYTGYKHATHLNYIPQPGDIRYADLNGDGDVNALDKTSIGKTVPSLTYSLGFDFSYKAFDLNVFLFGINGFDVFNSQRAKLSSMNSQDMDHNKLNDFANNHWTLENQSTEYVRIDPSNSNFNDQISSFWIEDGSFLRIKDVQLGFNLSDKVSKKIGVKTFRIFVNASNLYCFTNYKGRDPEPFLIPEESQSNLNVGTDNGNYSLPRSYVGGLQIGF